jgi:hypothetical protein
LAKDREPMAAPYLPFSTRICLNQHHWLANRLREYGIGFKQLANAFLKCAAPDRLQALANSLDPRDLVTCGQKWLAHLTPFEQAGMDGEQCMRTCHGVVSQRFVVEHALFLAATPSRSSSSDFDNRCCIYGCSGCMAARARSRTTFHSVSVRPNKNAGEVKTAARMRRSDRSLRTKSMGDFCWRTSTMLLAGARETPPACSSGRETQNCSGRKLMCTRRWYR